MHLRSLTNDELIMLQRQTDPLVATDLEAELARRLADALDELERLETEIRNTEDE